MNDRAIAQKSEARRVLLGAIDGGAHDRQLALAWVRLAGQVAPPGPALANRVTILTPIRLRSD
jgi:hypothetical protein